MATMARRPLTQRTPSLSAPLGRSPAKQGSQRIVSGSKRARSPEPKNEQATAQTSAKRSRSSLVDQTAPEIDLERVEKERKRKEKELAKEVFRTKYTNAFPKFRFHFDLDPDDPSTKSTQAFLQSSVKELGATCDEFFSNQITHLITDKAIPVTDPDVPNKENSSKPRSTSNAKSPVKHRSVEDTPTFDIVQKALAFERKVWSSEKLRSILERLAQPNQPSNSRSYSTVSSSQRPLTRLLEVERLHGTTERDPSQRRHDFRYFSKGSFFVLVEDMRQDLATIHALEYPVTKSKDGSSRGAWPVLHCHPHSRGPFIEFDDKERRAYEKATRAEDEREAREHEQRKREEASMRRRAQAEKAKNITDLRRCASMNNLRRRESHGETTHFNAVEPESVGSANASGYLASTSGYMAASGNSVGITSTTGTTSTVGLRKNSLPSGLRAQERQQVITSRKVAMSVSLDTSGKPGSMGPPAMPSQFLRKTKSTNSIRLPKRQEGAKPGYCESCRVKFEDFKTHTSSRSHRKFATNNSNFLQLDFVLGQVKRRTVQEVENEHMEWETRCREAHSQANERDFLSLSPQDLQMKEMEWEGNDGLDNQESISD